MTLWTQKRQRLLQSELQAEEHKHKSELQTQEHKHAAVLPVGIRAGARRSAGKQARRGAHRADMSLGDWLPHLDLGRYPQPAHRAEVQEV